MTCCVQPRCARVISAGRAFIPNIHRGHRKPGTEEALPIMTVFGELALAI